MNFKTEGSPNVKFGKLITVSPIKEVQRDWGISINEDSDEDSVSKGSVSSDEKDD